MIAPYDCTAAIRMIVLHACIDFDLRSPARKRRPQHPLYVAFASFLHSFCRAIDQAVPSDAHDASHHGQAAVDDGRRPVRSKIFQLGTLAPTDSLTMSHVHVNIYQMGGGSDAEGHRRTGRRGGCLPERRRLPSRPDRHLYGPERPVPVYPRAILSFAETLSSSIGICHRIER